MTRSGRRSHSLRPSRSIRLIESTSASTTNSGLPSRSSSLGLPGRCPELAAFLLAPSVSDATADEPDEPDVSGG
jgi:hypothetical protein